MNKPLSTFGLPGRGAAVVRCGDIRSAIAAISEARARGFPVFPIGEGSNCVFLEKHVPAVFIRSSDRAIRRHGRGSRAYLTAGAGLPWDALVKFAVARGLGGIESLSGIPGTCGAAPVQNIGAYGSELSHTLASVQVIDLRTLRERDIPLAGCRFGYRRSIFNTTHRGRFFIASITLRLKKDKKAPLIARRRAILRTRRQKLPDYKKIPNCGSFFKNPIIGKAAAKQFLENHPDAPHWPESKGMKLSAAWLIERSGMRHKRWGNISISPDHALILVNLGETDHRFIKKAIADLQSAVRKKFKITITPEPNLLEKSMIKNILRQQRIPG